MDEQIQNEDSGFTYNEIMPGVTQWVATGAGTMPETLTVTSEGLRALLALIGDCWPLVMGAAMSGNPKVENNYAKDMTPERLSSALNRISKVWCEGEVIVGGLFVVGGKVLVNKDDGDGSGDIRKAK